MNDCPRCFWLKLHKIWERPSGIFPSLPSGMDRILKIHFNKFRDKGELPPEICDNPECKGMKLFEDKEQLIIWQNNFKGVSFTDNENNVLRGAVDNILVKEKKHVVLDYKTRGYPLKENTANYSQNQLDLYTYLLQKNGYETEDFAFLLFYIPKEVLPTGEVIFDTTLVKMKVDVKNAEKLWKNALKLLDNECPIESCKWCKGYKEQEETK